MPFEPWKEETPDAVQEQEAPPPEPVAEAAPEPAPAAETPAPRAEAAPIEKRTDDAVPLAKALEWRNQWRDTERKLQEAMERLKALEKPPEPQVQVPRYEDDPVEHLRVKTEMQEAEVRALREQRLQEDAQRQALAARQQFVGWYQNQAGEFAKQQADFNDAYKHAVGAMQAILSRATDDPHQVAGALEAWEAGVVRRAAAEGRNPAADIYEAAKALNPHFFRVRAALTRVAQLIEAETGSMISTAA